MESRLVSQFKVGDGIRILGWNGTVMEIDKQERDGRPCTYLRVAFDKPDEIGSQYNDEWYGGDDELAAFGYFKR